MKDFKTLKPVICIAGPTASGKTGLAVELASYFDCEAISADSMQLYKGMDIGTAKPSPEEQARLKHHMISVAGPEEEMSVARYSEQACACIADCHERNVLPLIVGGTGMYIDSLLYHSNYAPEPGDTSIRAELTGYYEKNGADALFDLLKTKDPEAAQRIHPNNVKRVIRALEIIRLTGMTTGEYYATQPPVTKRFPFCLFFLNPTPREFLYKRIEERVDIMVGQGLLDEVKGLLENGFSQTSLQGIAYKETVEFLNGVRSWEETVELIKKRTRNYAKRQLTWFNASPDAIKIDYTETTDKNEMVSFAVARIHRFLDEIQR